MFVAIFFFVNAVVVILTINHDFQANDVGDAFVKLREVAKYADERLVAATNSLPLPEPPQILADQFSLRVALLATLFSQVLLFGLVGIASKQEFSALVRVLKLNEYSFWGVWRPATAVIAAYLLVAGYVYFARAFLPGILVPESTIPSGISRESSTLAIAFAATVVGAPFTEELFFRGFVFAGLTRWGFWPAAAISALLFAFVHFDPGSVVPFFAIGLAMAWLFWSRGSLWDAVLFHFLFNLTSFLILAAN
ncbi:MAG: CPBP family intramembrane glutamic endopeptidase [Tepidiformaceae bacterium]